MFFKGVILGAALLALCSCATSPVSSGDAKEVPRERLFAYQENLPGSGTVRVIRDAGFLGHSCGISVTVDGQRAATLATSEKVDLKIPTGKHILGASFSDKGLCGFNGSSAAMTRTIEADVETDHLSIYRIALGGELSIMPVQL